MHSVSEVDRKRQPAAKLSAQVAIIVDLAVVGDHCRPGASHRLPRGIAQIDDREAAVDEPGAPGRGDPAALARRGRDARSAGRAPRARRRGAGPASHRSRQSSDAAHGLLLGSVSKKSGIEGRSRGQTPTPVEAPVNHRSAGADAPPRFPNAARMRAQQHRRGVIRLSSAADNRLRQCHRVQARQTDADWTVANDRLDFRKRRSDER